MIIIKFIHSFRFKIIYYFTGVTTLLTLIFGIIYLQSFKKTIKENLFMNSKANLEYITNTIDSNLLSAGSASLWFGSNKEQARILSISKERVSYSIQDQLNLQNLFSEQILNSIIGKYLVSVTSIGDNGVFINSGKWDYSISKFSFENKLELKNLVNKEDLEISFEKIIGINERFTYGDLNLIPIIMPIKRPFTNRKIGNCIVFFDSRIISDVFAKYNLNPNVSFYVLNDLGICISSKDNTLVGTKLDYTYMDKIRDNKSGYFEVNNKNEKKLILHQTTNYNLVVVQEIILDSLLLNKQFLYSATLNLILSILFISIFLHFVLSKKLVKPINLLLLKMKAIADGDFHSEIKATSKDELGVLEDGIDQMSLQIEKFIEQKVLQEHEKKELEIKILQNQINPHFLYNTLSSIKFMATIQKTTGITECIGALSRILRSTARNKSKEITIDEELSLIKDYFFIQKIRYNGNIELEVILQDESLKNFKILKFTLQPIIENAIFHGIEPNDLPGKVNISIYQEKEDIFIEILDNGIGMNDDVISKIFDESYCNDSLKSESVGVKNVDERIKLTYGKSYGLFYESKKNLYTKCIIKIPKII